MKNAYRLLAFGDFTLVAQEEKGLSDFSLINDFIRKNACFSL